MRCRSFEALHWQAIQQARQNKLFPRSSPKFRFWNTSSHNVTYDTVPVTEVGDNEMVHVIHPLSWRPVNSWEEEEISLKEYFTECINDLHKQCSLKYDSYKCYSQKGSKIIPSNTSKVVNPVAEPKPGQFPAPVAIWKQDMDYKDTVTISFLMQYFRQPKVAPKIVDRLYNCTKGLAGAFGGLNITTELIVHVDEASAVDMWQELYNRTREGHFLTLMFSHNLAEVRGYNRMAQIARGRVIMMLQDDEHPPENCAWLPKVLKLFEMFPRTGVVGMRTSNLATYDPHYYSRRPQEIMAFERRSGQPMHFASLVDSSPMLYHRRAYWYLGGQDEAMMGGKGESGIMTDWDMALRAWLAGFYVSHMAVMYNETFWEVSKGGTHHGIGAHTRRLNSWLNPWRTDYDDRILEEVKRTNGFLKNVWADY